MVARREDVSGVEHTLCSSTSGAHARLLSQAGAVLCLTRPDGLLVVAICGGSYLWLRLFVLTVEEGFTP